jgi:hypothetical protein
MWRPSPSVLLSVCDLVGLLAIKQFVGISLNSVRVFNRQLSRQRQFRENDLGERYILLKVASEFLTVLSIFLDHLACKSMQQIFTELLDNVCSAKRDTVKSILYLRCKQHV